MVYNQTLDKYTQDRFCKIFSVQRISGGQEGQEIHRHNFFQIILIRKGTLKHWIDFEVCEAKSPYISVVFPNQIHKLELNPDAEGDILMFDETVFCSSILSNELKEYNIDLQNRLNHVKEIPADEWNNIGTLLDHIRALWKDINLIRKMEIKFLIKIILLKVIDFAPVTSSMGNIDADLQIYQQFREFVNEEFASQRKVHYYADKLNISTKKLTSVCYKYTGHSPLEIIHEKLSIELKKTIVEDGMLLKEVAFQYGFSSQSALNKFIEKHFGCSPQVWRAELEKNMLGKI